MDASALVAYLLGADAATAMRPILRRREVDLQIPVLCDIEVVAGLRRGLARKLLNAQRASEALLGYGYLPLTRHGHLSLLPRILELRSNFSAYDACYVALAEGLRGSLLTVDERLSRAVQRHTSVPVLP